MGLDDFVHLGSHLEELAIADLAVAVCVGDEIIDYGVGRVRPVLEIGQDPILLEIALAAMEVVMGYFQSGTRY